MGEIKDQFASVYRDFSVDGVAASGVNEPLKSELRALGPLIEQAIGTMGLGSMVDVAYATRAALDADLAHDAGSVGLVYADATGANNDLYVKTGASGAGAWTLTSAIHDILAGLTAGYASDVDLAAKLAKSANLSDVENTETARSNISAASAAQGAKADSALQPGAAITGLAETTDAKIMTGAERMKLAGIAAGAQVNAVTSVAAKTGAVTLVKADVGLGNVDNTSDANKPVSTDQATAIAAGDAGVIGEMAADPRSDLIMSDEFQWMVGGASVTPAGFFRAFQEFIASQTVAQDENGHPLLFTSDDGGLNMALGSLFMSDEYSQVMGVTDEGQFGIGFKPNGDVTVFHGDRIMSEWNMMTSENGVPYLRWNAVGQVEIGPELETDWRVEIRGADDDNRHVYLSAPGRAEIQLTGTAGPYRGAERRGAWLTYLDMTSGVGVETRVQLFASTALASTIDTLIHLISLGQSLSIGQYSSPVQTSAAFDPGRAVMFSAGIKTTGTAQSGGFLNEPVSASDVASFVNAVESGTESPMSQSAVEMLAGEAATTGALLSAHGIGGASYAQLKKGTVPYNNMIVAVRRAYLLCALLGIDYAVPWLAFNHGQANVTASKATYLGYLTELQADVTADFNAIIPGTGEVMLVLEQMSNWTPYGVATSEVPLAQLQAYIDHPDKFAMVGPSYMFNTIDLIHNDGPASANMGARRGRMLAQLRAGTYAGPLYILSAVRTGATIVLTYNRPHGGAPLDIHTGLVTDPGDYGFVFVQTGGSAVMLTSIAATGDAEISIGLSATPTGTAQKIHYAIIGAPGDDAGPTSGPRGCIRSATADTDSFGAAMDHYAEHQIIDVTT